MKMTLLIQIQMKVISMLQVLYYVVSSDGDTVIYNERTESKTYTVKQRVTPKQGRVVIFDGGLYHTAQTMQVKNLDVLLTIIWAKNYVL